MVDDGSSDDTAIVAKRFKTTVLTNKHNLGKTLSVKKGVKAAKNQIIMMLDADFLSIDQDSITKLAHPVLSNQTDWSLAILGNSLPYMRLFNMDWTTGQRVIPKELLNDPLIWSKPKIGYGIETLINVSLLKKKKTFCAVYLPNAIYATKVDKIGKIAGWIGGAKMIYQISKAIPLYKVLGQFIKMSSLNRKYSRTVNLLQ